jgi:hypothetical protein
MRTRGNHFNFSADDSAVGLDGKWVPIFQPGLYESEIDPDDLDDIVRNYPPDGQKAVVGVERDWSGAKAHGQVDEVRRIGPMLMGKLSNVDPRLDQLHRAGTFNRTCLTVANTPQGKALKRVGFVRDGSTTTLDQIHRDQFSKKEIFRDGSQMHVAITLSESDTQRPSELNSSFVQRLKARGKWLSFYDESGIPILFSELERSVTFGEGQRKVAAEKLATFLESMWPTLENSELARRAERLARDRDISYGEALDKAMAERVRFVEDGSAPGIRPFAGSVLVHAAQRLADRRNIPFGDAMSQIVEEATPAARSLMRQKKGLPFEDALDSVLADTSHNFGR